MPGSGIGRGAGSKSMIEGDSTSFGGAIGMALGAFLPFLTRMMGQGVYEIPKVEIAACSAVWSARMSVP